MKKVIFILLLGLLVTLSSCNQLMDLDYTDFTEHLVNDYSDVEDIEDTRFIAYYYHEDCGGCINIKKEILNFFYDFEDLPFYILNTANVSDHPTWDDFRATPAVFLVSDGVVVESWTNTEEVRNFIDEFSDFDNFEFDYDHFDNQHIYTYEQALNIDKEAYIIYYYLDNCPHCMRTKPHFLKWAFTRGIDEIYFMNGAEINDPDNKPTELLVLNSGTPILVVMTNGKFADEFYSGTEEVMGYIEAIGDGEITTDNFSE